MSKTIESISNHHRPFCHNLEHNPQKNQFMMRLGKIHISRHYRITENEWKCIKIQKLRKINYISCVILQITTCSEQAVIWFWKNVFLDNQMNVMHKKLIKLPFWIDRKTFFCEGRRAFFKHDSLENSKLHVPKVPNNV